MIYEKGKALQSARPKVAGIDGCRAGWIAFVDDGASVTPRIIRSETGLKELFVECDRIFIDMPVGLSDSGGRACDVELRNALPLRKKASVFMTPVRSAVYAADYREACDLNLKAAGRKISIQAWNITNRIRQVDELLRADASLFSRLYECHPEWQFYQFSGGEMPSKKTVGGVDARLKLLAKRLPDAPERYDETLRATLRKDVQPDDILDAMLLVLVARLSTGGASLLSFPAQPQYDPSGLPMNIWYVDGIRTA